MHNNPILYLFGKTWEYSPSRYKIVLYWLMFIVSEALDLAVTPFVWAAIIKIVTEQGVNDENIKVIALYLTIIPIQGILSWIFHGPARCIERVSAFRAKINYTKFLLGGIMSMPLAWHVEHHTGDTVDRIGKGTGALFNFAESSFVPIRSIFRFIGSFAVLAYFSPVAGVMAACIFVVNGYITSRFDKVLIGQWKALNRAENEVAESTNDAITNISTIIVLRVERFVFDAIIHKMESRYGLFWDNQKLNEWKWFVNDLCWYIMAACIGGIYMWQHHGVGPGVLVGQLYLLINYLGKMGEVFNTFTQIYSQIVRSRTNIANAEELSHEFIAGNIENHVLPKNWSTIQIRNLNFSYFGAEAETAHLQDISLDIRRGTRVALIGQTGSGKTTFLKILRDLYQPHRLELLVDGQAIPHGFEGIKRAITLVQQNPEIFAATIRTNITMGAEYTDDLIRQYTDMACVTDVINELPHGLASSIKEKGVNLSGGQQQRIALARGFLACHDKDVILLDEPTSSLDVVTQLAVYRNAFSGFAGRTIISTVHQLSLLPLFDTIVLFDNGRIIAQGTLQELLSTSPEFCSLWAANQAAG